MNGMQILPLLKSGSRHREEDSLRLPSYQFESNKMNYKTKISEEEEEEEEVVNWKHEDPVYCTCKFVLILLLLLVGFSLLSAGISSTDIRYRINLLQLDHEQLQQNLLSLESHLQQSSTTLLPWNVMQDLEQLHQNMLLLQTHLQEFNLSLPLTKNLIRPEQFKTTTSAAVPESMVSKPFVRKDVAYERSSSYPDSFNVEK